MGGYLVPMLRKIWKTFSTVLSLQMRSARSRPETYFCPHEDQEIQVFLKITWGQADRASREISPLRSNGIYVKKGMSSGLVSGKGSYSCAGSAESGLRAWLKAGTQLMNSATMLDLNDLVNTSISPEILWIQTLLRAFWRITVSLIVGSKLREK